MYSLSLLNKILAIICLSIVVFGGAVDSAENGKSEIDDHRVFVRMEFKNITTPKNKTIKKTKYELCPNGKGFCPIEYSEVKTIDVWEMKAVPVYKCRDGYKEVNEICAQICKNGCEHSSCVAPEQCKCIDGYANDKNDLRVCNPVCDECEHGKCISPNNCKCDDDYQWNTDHKKCIPICKPDCIFGKCISPNECQCDSGFQLKIGSAEGYQNVSSHECQPICSPNCLNGECVSPNKCQCYKGYHFINESTTECEPTCSNCINGNCVAPDECQCKDGYKKDSSNKCEPICESNCINGQCTSPNRCTCTDGYGFKKDSLNVCEPICSMDCLNGECISPNQCRCNRGYRLKGESQTECEPICNAGYRLKEEGSSKECEAICNDPSCKNEKCVTPHECMCHEEYPFKNESSKDCVPICKIACINGKCTAPDQCKCNDGYQLETGSSNNCVPACKPECENAKCIEPNVCECNKGYEKFNNESAQNICCPICGGGESNDGGAGGGKGADLNKDCTNNICISAGNCQQCADGQRSIGEVNYNKSTEQLLSDPTNENLPTVKSGFNWWIILGIGVLLIVSAVIVTAFRCYRNRKIDYYIGNEASVQYGTKKN